MSDPIPQAPSSALTTTPANQAPAVRSERTIRVVESSIALYDTAKFEHMSRIAMGMAKASIIPDHLQKDKDGNFLPADQVFGNCLLIVNQAMRWDIDPFGLAAESYMVKGKLGYQGKAIQAVVEDRLKRKLKYRYNSGTGDNLAIVVYLQDDGAALISPEAKELLVSLCEKDDKSSLADLQDEHGIRAIRLSVGQAKTPNDIWRKDPEQKLVYSGTLKWARRYEPGIIMGIKSDDDLEADKVQQIDETLPKAALPQRTIVDQSPEVLNPPKPAAASKKEKEKPKATPAEATTTAAATPEPKPAAPVEEPKAAAQSEPTQESPFKLAEEAAAPAADLPPSVTAVVEWATSNGCTESDVLLLCQKYKWATAEQTSVAQLSEKTRQTILGDLENATAALLEVVKKGGAK